MKTILLMSALTLLLSAVNLNTAQASFPCTMTTCGWSINGDAGHTSTKCIATGGVDGCVCTAVSRNCTVVSTVAAGAPCPGGLFYLDDYLDGRKCCGKGATCMKKSDFPSINNEEITTTSEAGINEAFETNMDGRTNTYYGYVDGISRSPTNGRTSDPVAKLDACLHHPDVDAIDAYVGTADDKHHQCVGASIGCGTTLKNEYCQASGTNDGATVAAAVCKDRCDCIYPGAEGSACGGN
jgi:hypothetical protein